jgi:hypothetical protein
MTEKEKKRIDRLIRANTEYQKRIELLRDEIEVLKGNQPPSNLLTKLEISLDKAMESETEESLNQWYDEKKLIEEARREAERTFEGSLDKERKFNFDDLAFQQKEAFLDGAQFIINKLNERKTQM